MERLKTRLEQADRALRTLEALLTEQRQDAIVRDAAIQRFEYGFEAGWKAAQRHLRMVEGLEEGSPKAVVRACVRVKILDEADGRMALVMVDDRNLTSHTYNEALAQQIYSKLPVYAQLMRRWLDAMQRTA
ncbi:MAG: HI0074 family nucleotidyltransferase substrate-binding subunit [Mariprofundales bacterium]